MWIVTCAALAVAAFAVWERRGVMREYRALSEQYREVYEERDALRARLAETRELQALARDYVNLMRFDGTEAGQLADED